VNAMNRHIDVSSFLNKALEDHLSAQRKGIDANHHQIETVSIWICEALERDGKVLIFGNGGSAADAQHIAAEFVNRFRLERRPLPAIALTTDTSILTAIGNDYGFEQIFEKQVAALARPEDVVVGISTSGSSPNVLLGLKAARKIGARCVGFSGQKETEMDTIAHVMIKAATDDTPRVQESHILFGHLICDLVEQMLFAPQS